MYTWVMCHKFVKNEHVLPVMVYKTILLVESCMKIHF